MREPIPARTTIHFARGGYVSIEIQANLLELELPEYQLVRDLIEKVRTYTLIHGKKNQEQPADTAIAKLITDGLVTDGTHHKQWYIEQLAQALHVPLPDEYEHGVAP